MVLGGKGWRRFSYTKLKGAMCLGIEKGSAASSERG